MKPFYYPIAIKLDGVTHNTKPGKEIAKAERNFTLSYSQTGSTHYIHVLKINYGAINYDKLTGTYSSF